MADKVSDVARNNQLKKVEAFQQLHVPGTPLILYNIWDAGSAQAVAKSGAKAVATSSWAVARAQGFQDGEQIPFDLALENLRRIVLAVDVPVSVDLESGYGEEPERVARCISRAIDAGAVGCNLEDSIPATGALRDTATQVERIRAARKAAELAGVPFFINARCDLFFQGDAVPRDQQLLLQTVDRARAYADAGADGLFVPGLTTISLISELAKKSPIPLNILADATTSVQILADNGVARVSYGAAPYIQTIGALEQAARTVNR
jgi:2-methylisocitrate lyase-like PEP mutase family enzyme